MDLKFNKEKGYYDIDAENGDFALTYDIDTSILLNVLGENRAENSLISNPLNRRGHFLSELNGEVVGSDVWIYAKQSSNNEDDLGLYQSLIAESLNWLLEKGIVKKVAVAVTISTGNKLLINITITRNNDSEQYFDILK
tara:strand:- start:3391 stop:3807 length:417 start_codon:yes stop_codon:yes gene_type:complete